MMYVLGLKRTFQLYRKFYHGKQKIINISKVFFLFFSIVQISNIQLHYDELHLFFRLISDINAKRITKTKSYKDVQV